MALIIGIVIKLFLGDESSTAEMHLASKATKIIEARLITPFWKIILSFYGLLIILGIIALIIAK